MQKLGFSPAKKVFAYGSGDRNDRARSGNRTHFGSIFFQIDALSVHFDEAYQSFYMAQLYIMIRLSVLVSVLVSPVLFCPGPPCKKIVVMSRVVVIDTMVLHTCLLISGFCNIRRS